MEEKKKLQLSIAVCDDERADLQSIASLTREVLEEESIGCELAVYQDGASLLAAMESGCVFHILLIDVLMEDLDGIRLAAALRGQGNPIPIIFISANREMAMQGYVVEASRYLAKPVEQDLLREALLFCSRKYTDKKEILLQTSKGQSRIFLSNLLYAETWNRGIRLVLIDGSLESHMKISELAGLLPSPPFVFCHRTILVNLACAQHLRYCELEMKSGALLPVSKYRFAEVRAALLAYLRENP